ncbi:MAG: hypothetical protein Q7T01_03245 [bacterium]|nr:hypothetical protein [bacterium]
MDEVAFQRLRRIAHDRFLPLLVRKQAEQHLAAIDALQRHRGRISTAVLWKLGTFIGLLVGMLAAWRVVVGVLIGLVILHGLSSIVRLRPERRDKEGEHDRRA